MPGNVMPELPFSALKAKQSREKGASCFASNTMKNRYALFDESGFRLAVIIGKPQLLELPCGDLYYIRR